MHSKTAIADAFHCSTKIKHSINTSPCHYVYIRFSVCTRSVHINSLSKLTEQLNHLTCNYRALKSVVVPTVTGTAANTTASCLGVLGPRSCVYAPTLSNKSGLASSVTLKVHYIADSFCLLDTYLQPTVNGERIGEKELQKEWDAQETSGDEEPPQVRIAAVESVSHLWQFTLQALRWREMMGASVCLLFDKYLTHT